MSGIASICLTIAGFRFSPKLQRTLFWAAALACFLLASVRVWTTEHAKVMSQIASLDCSRSEVAFAGDPFPVGQKVQVFMVWHNYGPAPALNGQHFAKMYILSDNSRDSQRKMIADWKPIADQWLLKGRDPLFHPDTDRRIAVASDEIVTESSHRELFVDYTRRIFLLSAVRFTDGAGDHEAHACLFLMGVNALGLSWEECSEYVTTVDIPKRSFRLVP